LRDGGHRWGGGAGLVLFPDSNQRGPALEISQDVADLSHYRFNDRASSFYVSDGTWQVCEHANYRGRCEILTVGAGDLEADPDERQYLVDPPLQWHWR
jgi:hypothetical protein